MLFPYALIRGLSLYQCKVILSAENNNSFPILGAVTVTANLQGKNIEIDRLVTDHVDDVILGLDSLQAKGADCNFQTGKLTVDGQAYQLVDGRKRAHCRRMIIQDPVTIAARSQLDVPTIVAYVTYCSTWVDGETAWMSEAGEIAG